jgi:hypothetical protein
MPAIINLTTIGYYKDNLVLTLPADLKVLDGEVLRRRFKVLARLLNCELEVRIEPARPRAKSAAQTLMSRE